MKKLSTLLVLYYSETLKTFATNQQNFNLMKTEKHTTAKILLGLTILGIIYLLNIALFLIDKI